MEGYGGIEKDIPKNKSICLLGVSNCDGENTCLYRTFSE